MPINTLEPTQHLQGLEDAVLRNIQAVGELSDVVRTSFGPNGMLGIVDCCIEQAFSLTIGVVG